MEHQADQLEAQDTIATLDHQPEQHEILDILVILAHHTDILFEEMDEELGTSNEMIIILKMEMDAAINVM